MQTAFDIGRPIQVLILSEKVLKRVVEGLEKRENVDASLKSCNEKVRSARTTKVKVDGPQCQDVSNPNLNLTFSQPCRNHPLSRIDLAIGRHHTCGVETMV